MPAGAGYHHHARLGRHGAVDRTKTATTEYRCRFHVPISLFAETSVFRKTPMRFFFYDFSYFDLCRMLNVFIRLTLRLPIIMNTGFRLAQMKIAENDIAVIAPVRQITILYRSAIPLFYRSYLYIFTFDACKESLHCCLDLRTFVNIIIIPHTSHYFMLLVAESTKLRVDGIAVLRPFAFPTFVFEEKDGHFLFGSQSDMMAEFQFSVQQSGDQCFQRHLSLSHLSDYIRMLVFEYFECRNILISDKAFIIIEHLFGSHTKEPASSDI